MQNVPSWVTAFPESSKCQLWWRSPWQYGPFSKKLAGHPEGPYPQQWRDDLQPIKQGSISWQWVFLYLIFRKLEKTVGVMLNRLSSLMTTLLIHNGICAWWTAQDHLFSRNLHVSLYIALSFSSISVWLSQFLFLKNSAFWTFPPTFPEALCTYVMPWCPTCRCLVSPSLSVSSPW